LAYLRRNIAPVVEKIIIQEQGIAVRGFPQAQQQVQPAQLNLPPPSNRQARNNPAAAYQQQGQQAPQRIEPPPQGFTEPGSRSVVWSADDENDDELVYTVYYRGEGESRWKLMEGELTSKFHTWDAATLPDGAYYIRVVASDAPSNPPEMAQEGENVSDRFEVDNTPPRIDNFTTTVRGRAVEVRFASNDTYSTLQQADYSLDAGDWKMIFPESGTTDARQHSYRFRLNNMEAGEHTVVVRVYDRFDNPVLDKATFTIE
jgi:hypothetical protein